MSSNDRSEDSIEREIALTQLKEAVGKAVAIGMNDAEAKHGAAGRNAAALLNAGALELKVVVEWPGMEVYAFLDDPEHKEDPHPFFKVTMPEEPKH